MKTNKRLIPLIFLSSLMLSSCNPGESVHNHVDANNDHKCDVCNETLSSCKDDNNDHNCDVCGTKMSECYDSNNDHNCDVCGTQISNHIDTDSDHICNICNQPFSDHKDDNHDHYCDICLELFSNHYDNNIDGICDACGEGWSNATLALFNENLGEILPYFSLDVDFTSTEYSYIEALVNGDARSDIVSVFTATQKYTCEEGYYIDRPATFLRKVSDASEFTTIEVMLIFNNNVTYVDAYTSLTIVDHFPVTEVQNVLKGHTEESYPIPDDGTMFTFSSEENYCSVSLNGDPFAYLLKLDDAGFYIDYSMIEYYGFSGQAYRALSSGRTLAIQVTISETEYSIEFMGVEAPNETDWDEEVKSFFMTLFGEVLPFPNAGFTYDEEQCLEDITYHNHFMVESYNIDAFKYAVDAMKSDTSFTWEYTEDGGFYTFKKEVGMYVHEVIISILFGTTTMTFYKKIHPFTEWPSELIEECLNVLEHDSYPIPTGTEYSVNYDEEHKHIALVKVTGTHQNYLDYIEALRSAKYDVHDDSISDYEAVSPNGDLIIYVTDYTEEETDDEDYVPYYMVEINAKNVFTPCDGFPIDLVNEELALLSTSYEGPIPEGEQFAYLNTMDGDGEVCIRIYGGNKAEFLDALLNNGFVYDALYSDKTLDAYSNSDAHVVVYLSKTGTTDYYVYIGVYFDF